MLKITEHEFGDILLKSVQIQKLVKTNNFFIAREFKTGSAVPDFVLVARQGYDEILRLSDLYPAETFRGIQSSIIAMLYGPSRTGDLSLIAQANFTSYSSVLNAAKKLHNLEIVTLSTDKGLISRNHNFNLPKIDVVSIELKLHKWEKALWQASRNQAYYAKSYVVMPADKEELIRSHTNHFRVNRVSAAILDTSKGGVRLITPGVNQVSSERFTVERLAGLSYLMQGKNHFQEVCL